MNDELALSVVIVSFNTREVLAECLSDLERALQDIAAEVFVVDNASSDGSPEMIELRFPHVAVLRSDSNLGFAGANNVALRRVRGKYCVLLNSDAFLSASALHSAIAHMDQHPKVGLAGGRLVSADGSWQPSARLFPSPLNDLLTLSGLAARFSKSRFWGRFDRTWADPSLPAKVDWVPGAFSIIRSEVLRRVGLFDERFFLYYEEVDLCRRIKQAGCEIHYWPDIVVVHLGGESSRKQQQLDFSAHGSQLVLWRMRSQFLYYRKHHGSIAWWAKNVEKFWYVVRSVKNCLRGAAGSERVRESAEMLRLLRQAWRETNGGHLSPARPW